MFELKCIMPMEDQSGVRATIMYNGQRVCNVHTWGFACCGVLNLYSFGYPGIKDKQAFAKEFFKFLETVNDPTWKPCEAYLCLSDSQLTQEWLRVLCKHPEVKRRDRFYNKSHGPNHINLFRWSKAKDFKRMTKYG